jgi:PAS domain S-box-containing protein
MNARRNPLKALSKIAVISIGLGLVGAIIYLVIVQYHSQAAFQNTALKQVAYDSERRATTLGYFFSEQQDYLQDLAESRELSAYFENKALGMSMEYGLRASILIVTEHFDQVRRLKRLGDHPVYERIVFVDATGQLLNDSDSRSQKRSLRRNWREFLSPDGPGPEILSDSNEGELQIIVSAPCYFKGRYSGQVMGWISFPEIYNYFIEGKSETSRYPDAIIFGKEYLYIPKTAKSLIPPGSRPLPADIKPYQPYPLPILEKDSTSKHAYGILVPVKNTSFSLMTIIPPSEQFDFRSPRQLIYTAGGLALFIIAGVFILVRLNTHNALLRAHLEETSLRERAVEEKNRELAAEIRERQIVEKSLQTERDFVESMFETAQVIMLVLDNDGRIKRFNPYLEEISGYCLDEVCGKDWFSVFLPDGEGEPLRTIFRETLHGASRQCIVYQILTKDKHRRDIEWHEKIIRDREGRLVGLLAIGQDITESKRSRQLMELYLYALDNAKDQIFMNDRTSRFIYVNQAACTTLGYSRDELLDMGVGDIDPNFPTEAWEDHWQDLKSQGGLRLETYHENKDGRTYPVEMSLKSFEFDNAEYLLAVARDLTERKQREAEKLEMERRLLHSQKLESLGVLAGGIAHDFNNLLAAIMGNLELSLIRLPGESPVRWNVEQAIKASQRAADLTRQMLAYSGKGTIEICEIDLGELVRHNAELLRTSIPRSISMFTEASPGNSLIVGDPGQIQQVIMNLITNAAEAIGQGQGLITITTGSGDYNAVDLSKSFLEEKPSPGCFSWLEVADNGCGMDDETKRRVFEPFFTTKFTGRGLGMAAVLGIIRAHQGAIFVESAIAKGTRFRVLFPATEPARCTGTNINTPSPRIEAGSSVLVVDDEDMIRDFCCACIDNLGFKVLSAPDGLAAIELFNEHADIISLVILDLTMPRMDGVAAFKELRRIKPEVKIVVSSGYGEQDVASQFADKKPDAFIQKPYTVQALNEIIMKVLA